jgi:hypothetical protein
VSHSDETESGTVMATVHLRSASGRSLLEAESAALMEVEPYQPAEGSITRATRELTRRGFRVEAVGLVLSISGPQDLFERECHVTLRRHETRLKGKPLVRFWRSSEPVMHIPALDDVIEGIILAVPAVPAVSL